MVDSRLPSYSSVWTPKVFNFHQFSHCKEAKSAWRDQASLQLMFSDFRPKSHCKNSCRIRLGDSSCQNSFSCHRPTLICDNMVFIPGVPSTIDLGSLRTKKHKNMQSFWRFWTTRMGQPLFESPWMPKVFYNYSHMFKEMHAEHVHLILLL